MPASASFSISAFLLLLIHRALVTLLALSAPLSDRGSVLVCYCCCNKLPQIYLLKTTRICFLTNLEVGSAKWVSLYKIKAFFLEVLRKSPFSCVFQPLEAACIPCLVVPSVFKSTMANQVFLTSQDSISASLIMSLLTPTDSSASLFHFERRL